MSDPAATKLYTHALDRGRRGQLWSILRGRTRGLVDLSGLEASGRVRTCGEAAPRSVPLNCICGSESRAGDFDADFHPIQEDTQARWLSIASARRSGKTLPPVSLIQIGERYFCRDGHHRISVARALGDRTIEARVILWQVEGSLPWEPLHQPTWR